MAYVKLDTGILDSTLWVCREPREVFITALLMALPHEVTDPCAQLHVRSIAETGFVVPPGWYGFIAASGPGIVRRAGLPMDAGLDALKELGDPDPESRSAEFDGRRLVRVDGGFIVLNFMKYRDKDNTAAVRAHRYRDRKKSNATRDATPVTRDSSCGVTIAEAKAEAEAREKKEKTTRAARTSPSLHGVDPQVVADWIAMRKQKRAAVTETAIAGIAREASKAGMSLQDALAVSCSRGWTGFKAEWVQRGPQGTALSFREREAEAAAQHISRLTGGMANTPLRNEQPELIDVDAIEVHSPRLA